MTNLSADEALMQTVTNEDSDNGDSYECSSNNVNNESAMYTNKSSTTKVSILPKSSSGGANKLSIKLDSGASRCMSGVPGRLHSEVNVEKQNIYICGYDNSIIN